MHWLNYDYYYWLKIDLRKLLKLIDRPESGGPQLIPGGHKDALVKGPVRSQIEDSFLRV